MVLLIIIPIKWLFHWEYTLFSDKPKYDEMAPNMMKYDFWHLKKTLELLWLTACETAATLANTAQKRNTQLHRCQVNPKPSENSTTFTARKLSMEHSYKGNIGQLFFLVKLFVLLLSAKKQNS